MEPRKGRGRTEEGGTKEPPRLTERVARAAAPRLSEHVNGGGAQPESAASRIEPELSKLVAEAVSAALAGLRTELREEIAAALSEGPAAGVAVPKKADLPETDSSVERMTKKTTEMDKTYDPRAIEQAFYARWEESGYFKPAAQGEPYCIMLPPPNVTGSLHMGHAFQDTLMDALIRYQRMNGRGALWQCGTDHAGIATQIVVERQLGATGVSRHDLGRERFVDAVWRWKDESGGTITRQLRRMGASMDWSRERFTLDDELSVAVREVFISLFEEGLIYRGQRLVNWDPVLHTAISDLEVVSEEENGSLWHFRYPLADGTGAVTVATTRPETMLGDTAVAVHPEDERYRRFIGKRVKLPLTDREIPIVADDYVDPEFGSGCVKITPAHDFNDYAVGQRHDLPIINVFTPDAAINENAPERFRGLDRFAARQQVVDEMSALGLLAEVRDHKLMVPRGDRTQSVIEPYLTDQWYVRVAPLAAPAIAAVEDGRIRFVPENWSKTYFEWMRNIEDWCISRQLWWGHRIPAWYDPDGGIHVGRDEADARRRSGLGEEVTLVQDPDVLDTWFSSALWPFSTLGWPRDTDALKRFYPTDVLVTGFDIIFFWVARMIMMGLKFMGDVPFREVYIHGLVRDADGNKMSKSKGNILDPLDLIDGVDLETLVAKRTTGLMRPEDAPRIEAATRRQYADGIAAHGTDALRFTFAVMATQGRDIRFDLGRIGGYRNFCNKIWNASRFVFMVCEQHAREDKAASDQLGVAERWIRTRCDHALQRVHEGFQSYRFDLAAQSLYEFIWDEYCDWYIEIAKVTLYDESASAERKNAVCQTLLELLDDALRALHPLMPFITEAIWLKLAEHRGQNGETLMLQDFPRARGAELAASDRAQFEWLQAFILGVRRVRAEYDIEPLKRLPVLVEGGTEEEHAWLESSARLIAQLARTEAPEPVAGLTEQAATALAGSMTLKIPLSDLIDREAEAQRLEKELTRLVGEVARAEQKLANPAFVERAPATVVEKERAKLEEARASEARIRAQIALLSSAESE